MLIVINGVMVLVGVQFGFGVCFVVVIVMLGQGSLVQIGGDLDIVIEGNGYLEVQMFVGNLVYMCDGSLKCLVEGQIVIFEGYLLVFDIIIL